MRDDDRAPAALEPACGPNGGRGGSQGGCEGDRGVDGLLLQPERAP
jgi:hypothetical protein